MAYSNVDLLARLIQCEAGGEGDDIALWAMAGNRLTNLGQALWFFNPYSPNCRPNFPSAVGSFVIRIGDHCFYNPTAAYAQT